MPNATNKDTSLLGDLFDPDDNGHDEVTKTIVSDEHEVTPSHEKRISTSSWIADDTEAGNISLSENALKVLERRYLKKNEKGEVIETLLYFEKGIHKILGLRIHT